MAECPRCRCCAFQGGTCLLCGHDREEGLELPAASPDPDPAGDEGPGRWACRYCLAVFGSAEECSRHQADRHRGVGHRLVTDVEAG